MGKKPFPLWSAYLFSCLFAFLPWKPRTSFSVVFPCKFRANDATSAVDSQTEEVHAQNTDFSIHPLSFCVVMDVLSTRNYYGYSLEMPAIVTSAVLHLLHVSQGGIQASASSSNVKLKVFYILFALSSFKCILAEL